MTGRVAATAAALAALWAGPAYAVCEERADIRQNDPSASLAVGDSVMLAAAQQLASYGFAVDAQSCRRFDQGLEILRERELPDLVVVALGSNAAVTGGQIESALALLGPYGRLVLVLPRALGGGPDPDGEVMRAAEAAHPDQVSVLDWPTYSAAHDDWFASDGLHLTGAGARAFAQFVAESGELPPADQIAPAPAPEPKAPPHRSGDKEPAEARGSPAVAGAWRVLARTLAAIVQPAIRLLGQLVNEPAGRPDL